MDKTTRKGFTLGSKALGAGGVGTAIAQGYGYAGAGSWLIPNLTIFIASVCVMAIELVAGRLTSMHLGQSLYTWTSVIGVILAGISLGNYIGGRVADRFNAKAALALLFIVSSAACLTIPATNTWLSKIGALQGMHRHIRIILHVTIAFIIPATSLGMIGPVVATMALNQGRAAGRTLGSVYAWGAVGSIAGTYLAGFYLVAALGSVGVVATVACALAIMAFFYRPRSWYAPAWVAVSILAALAAMGPWSFARKAGAVLGFHEEMGPEVLYRSESQYSRILVTSSPDNPNVRFMHLDKLLHSAIDLDHPLQLQYQYEQVYAQVLQQVWPDEAPMTAMNIGGGGYVYPRYLELKYPGSHIEVSEIDPEVTQAAREVFGLVPDSKILAYDRDARNYVSDLMRRKRTGQEVPVFDFIFGDSINDFSVPFHLTTVEFTRQLRDLLSPNGLYLLNLIDILEQGRFLGAVINTCRQVFPHVYAFKCSQALRDTFVVVSSNQALDLTGIPEAIAAEAAMTVALLSPEEMQKLEQRNDGLVLTDDYAPVDNLLAGVVQKDQKLPEVEYSNQGVALLRAEKYEEAIGMFVKAIQANPETQTAHENLVAVLLYQAKQMIVVAAKDSASAPGLLQGARNKLQDAVGVCNQWLKGHPDDRGIREKLHFACAWLGEVLASLGELDQGAAYLAKALEINPQKPKLLNELGVLFAKLDRPDKAVTTYRIAAQLDPKFIDPWRNMGFVLDRQGKTAEAVDAYKKALEIDPDQAPIINEVAMILSTDSDPGVRDGHEAVRLAERACALTEHKDAGYLDTLAAAYAETGQFDKAVQTEQKALELAGAANAADLIEAFQAALARYQAGQPTRRGATGP